MSMLNFTSGQLEDAKKLLEARFRGSKQTSSQQNNTAPVAELSNADELIKYAKMKEDGILTEEEFTQMKKKLLGL